MEHLPFLNFVGLKCLILSTTRIYSKAGAEKLQKVIPKTTEVTKLSERQAIIKNKPMADRIMKEIKKRKYNIEVIINE